MRRELISQESRSEMAELLEPLKQKRRWVRQVTQICLKMTLLAMVLVTLLAVASGVAFALKAGTIGFWFHLTVGMGIFCCGLMLITGILMIIGTQQRNKIEVRETILAEELSENSKRHK